ncbi:hypothetical protein TWF718_010856 [Orbilia javanica]|uniref:Uncharacterized protein n=1 Tax=Orbilia javanica TaxID=47235 RepID=A0AAN8RK49_9PEZI
MAPVSTLERRFWDSLLGTLGLGDHDYDYDQDHGLKNQPTPGSNELIPSEPLSTATTAVTNLNFTTAMSSIPQPTIFNEPLLGSSDFLGWFFIGGATGFILYVSMVGLSRRVKRKRSQDEEAGEELAEINPTRDRVESTEGDGDGDGDPSKETQGGVPPPYSAHTQDTPVYLS